jgi:hypothetical protein
MSLTIPRPTQERASVLLPTVTCSSCSAPIPLSTLGDHVCLPPSRATGSRAVPRPSQLSIPSSRPTARSPLAGSSPLGRSEPSSSSSASSSSRPFAGPSSVSSGSGSGSASRTRQAPPALDIPPRDSSVRAPSPLSGGGQYLANPTTSSSRGPSPTNPFFPHHDDGDGVVVHGLGLGVGGSSRREGPYPTDRPLPAGLNGPGLQDGAAGMAGVGRRAFAAAAWGVRAGVAMANAGAQRISPVEQTFPPSQAQHSVHSSSPTPSHIPLEPPSRPAEPRARSPFGNGNNSGNVVTPVPQVTGENNRPRAPLANRPSYSRNPSMSSVSTHVPSHESSSSAMSQRSATAPIPNAHRRAESSSSSGSRDDSISQLLRARADPTQEKKPAFFEKYKQFVAVADGRNTPLMALDKPDKITSSPEHTTLRIEDDDDDDDGESALPWMKATPNASPAIPQVPVSRPTIQPRSNSQVHSRQHTLDSSSGHSSSSSRSGGNGGSGPESEEVVTPSQSWEGGLVDRVGGLARKVTGDRELEKIGEEEEDEGDRVVFNTGLHPNSTYRPSISLSRRDPSPTLKDTYAPPPHVRSHTAPSPRPTLGQRSGSKRTKQCQNCLEIVGGTRRFVERDGIVLCEKDWKALYLPSCRRCQLPIEKSAVSSSDGQLKGKWHKECFSCTKCSMPFEGDSFYVLAGKPWCQYHYHEEK